MKRTLAILVLLSLAFTFTACGESKIKEISCEDIISAYENAGYYVVHGEHKDEGESSQLCYIKACISEESDSDYIYFITCFTEEDAKAAYDTDKYNLATWMFATASGESRWLKAGVYGRIEYSYYNPELIEPFEELIK